MASEADLYAPVKTMLAALGYEVKAEVNGCDVVAVKPGVPTVVVELKLTFSLELLLQGVDRLAVSDSIYLAILTPSTAAKRRNWRARQRRLQKLCRMLGFGLILVTLEREEGDQAEILLDPAPYAPRKNTRRQASLKSEFAQRAGDPNTGGVTRTRIITAYRQDAIRCARSMDGQEDMKLSDIRTLSGVTRAASILQNNHYNWFERTARGVYRLSPRGRQELLDYAADLLD